MSFREEYLSLSVTQRPTFKKDLVEMIFALFITSFGVVLSVKACQGASPIASLPNVISAASGISLGTALLLTYTLFVIIQWILIRDKHRILLTLSQIPFTIVFSVFVDFIEILLEGWVVSDLTLQWILTVLSVLIIGFGVVLEIDANISMLADDGLVLAIHQVTRVPVSRVLLIFDIAFVASAFILSYAVFHDFVGVGLGTIFAALTLGFSVKLFTKVVRGYIRKDGNVEME